MQFVLCEDLYYVFVIGLMQGQIRNSLGRVDDVNQYNHCFKAWISWPLSPFQPQIHQVTETHSCGSVACQISLFMKGTKWCQLLQLQWVSWKLPYKGRVQPSYQTSTNLKKKLAVLEGSKITHSINGIYFRSCFTKCSGCRQIFLDKPN